MEGRKDGAPQVHPPLKATSPTLQTVGFPVFVDRSAPVHCVMSASLERPAGSVRMKQFRSRPGTFPCIFRDIAICSQPSLVNSCHCFVSRWLFMFRVRTISTICRSLAFDRVAKSVTPIHSIDRRSTRVRPVFWSTVDRLTSPSRLPHWDARAYEHRPCG